MEARLDQMFSNCTVNINADSVIEQFFILENLKYVITYWSFCLLTQLHPLVQRGPFLMNKNTTKRVPGCSGGCLGGPGESLPIEGLYELTIVEESI